MASRNTGTGADYLGYLQNPSAYAVARAIEVTQQTVTGCLERAAELGVNAALDDRPRADTIRSSGPRQNWRVEFHRFGPHRFTELTHSYFRITNAP